MTEKITKNLIAMSIIAAALIVGVAIICINPSFLKIASSGTLTSQQAGEKAIQYINEKLLQGGTTASLVSTVEESGNYKVHFKILEKEYDSYVTKNGKIFFAEGMEIEKTSATPTPTPQESGDSGQIQKQDKPDVELFVMSYCPYGLQAEKAFLPVYDLLKSKADMGIYFVNYIMHGEKEMAENLKQYCIQKEENDKLSAYLKCFSRDGDSAKCSTEAKINSSKISTCVATTDDEFSITEKFNDKSTWLGGQYPRFDIHDTLVAQYGVQGSPTLVINGKVAQVSSRSPEQYKKAVCDAFTTAPDECSQVLSDAAASAGFGESTGSSTNADCGQ